MMTLNGYEESRSTTGPLCEPALPSPKLTLNAIQLADLPVSKLPGRDHHVHDHSDPMVQGVVSGRHRVATSTGRAAIR
jgi:hypothetical protein